MTSFLDGPLFSKATLVLKSETQQHKLSTLPANWCNEINLTAQIFCTAFKIIPMYIDFHQDWPLLRAPQIYVVKNFNRGQSRWKSMYKVINMNAVQKFWPVKFISLHQFSRRVWAFQIQIYNRKHFSALILCLRGRPEMTSLWVYLGGYFWEITMDEHFYTIRPSLDCQSNG